MYIQDITAKQMEGGRSINTCSEMGTGIIIEHGHMCNKKD